MFNITISDFPWEKKNISDYGIFAQTRCDKESAHCHVEFFFQRHDSHVRYNINIDKVNKMCVKLLNSQRNSLKMCAFEKYRCEHLSVVFQKLLSLFLQIDM